ncbi:MAG: hypothetical protein U9M98_02720 [Patescibacteria group bacterium]|nr:hypothetical protein [Patescibacteria group bacterium]
MNILGHPLVTTEVCGRMNPDLVLGSYLPDIVPFVPNTVFEFEEIHEGGLKFLKHLEKHALERRDVALGMLCHSAQYGADKHSRVLEERFEEHRDSLGKRIAHASNIPLEVAKKARFHNYLWWGFDVQILRHHEKFCNQLDDTFKNIDRERTARFLANCFGKEAPLVLRDVNYLLKPLHEYQIFSVGGLVRIWKDMAAGLPEGDEVDVPTTIGIFEDCAMLVEDVWEDVLSTVIQDVKDSLEEVNISLS